MRGQRVIRGDEGSSLVEMAIAIPVFLSVLIGIMIVVLSLYANHFVADAAREASRYAMVRGGNCSTNTPSLANCPITPSALQTWVKNLGYPGLNPNNLTVTTTFLNATTSGSPPTTSWSACAGTCNSPGNMVKVVVTYGYPLNIPFWRNTTLNLSSASEMVISQ
jgi:Flp pilus assembly protein TadG